MMGKPIEAMTAKLKEIHDGAYVGYSVAMGAFSSPQMRLYVMGAPRGNNCKGQVCKLSNV